MSWKLGELVGKDIIPKMTDKFGGIQKLKATVTNTFVDITKDVKHMLDEKNGKREFASKEKAAVDGITREVTGDADKDKNKDNSNELDEI